MKQLSSISLILVGTIALTSCDFIEGMRYKLDNLFLSSSSDDNAETVDDTVAKVTDESSDLNIAPPQEEVAAAEVAIEEVAYELPDIEQTDYIGSINNKYQITAVLTLTDNGLSGKYAYNSTVQKYGDSPQSYMYLEPANFLPGTDSYTMIAKVRGNDEPIERWEIYGDGSSFTGEITNLSSGKTFTVELSAD